MNDDVRFERLLEDLLVSSAPARAPAQLRPDIASTTQPARQRPRWLALIKEPPMRLPSGLAVGSPTVRLASVMAMTLALVLAAAGAVAVGASILQSDLPPPFGLARNGSLVYSDAGDIWVADETGANGVPILTGPEKDLGPWYSHDGTRIAFTRELADGSSTLMVARADGTEVVALVPDYTYADWSPDDSQFVVSHMVDGQLVVSIVAADGNGIVRNLDIGGLDLPGWGPVWRPTDGVELIFLGQTPGASDLGLYAIRADGTGLRTIGDVATTPDARRLTSQSPNLSPDGSLIGYSNWETNEAGETNAWAHFRDLSTGADRREVAYQFPHFSPDGTTVMGEPIWSEGLVVASLDGRSPVRAIPATWIGNGNRAWDISPDGTKAYFTVGVPKATWIIDLASGTSAETSQPIRDLPYWQRLAP